MTNRTLSPVPCPVCGAVVDGVTVEEGSIRDSKRIPVLIPAKCDKDHSVVLFVDRNFTVRDVVEGYFRGARIALAVYDANRYFSLERLEDWITRLKENAPDSALIFVGNKIDERQDGSGVTLDKGRQFAAKYGAACVEVSAKTGEGVAELFHVVPQSLTENP